MYTSDTKQAQKTLRRTALVYLAASIFCAVFGAIYEIFSHGVISFFMVCSFLFPLLCGFLPFLLLSIASKNNRLNSRYSEAQQLEIVRGDARSSLKKESRKRKQLSYFYPSYIARSFYHSGVIAFTVGSIVSGVLEIYGTTNVLIAAYWFAGAALMLVGILSHLLSCLFRSRASLI